MSEKSSKTASQRADELFFTAMEMESDEERKTFIDQACDGSPELKEELNRLLGWQAGAEQFKELESSTHISASDIVNTFTDIPEFFSELQTSYPDDNEVGKQIGPYTLLQKIGEGGVGNVYLAEQRKPVRRQVALKIIKAGMDTKRVIARFEAERQALAMMEHPNIAHVLNAGQTETGRPYFVMELVTGKRITTYCDENGLSIEERLSLFIQVCHAIQHAHQKGIIHRDIKPSNVLITKHDNAAHPVVIDFGIAKATGGDLLTDKTVNTSTGPIIGTPAYMSPEQTALKEVDIDTRSDVYSLGALLYELLISCPPFDHQNLLKAGLDELYRILREEDPPSLPAKLLELTEDERERIAKNRSIEPRRLSGMLKDDLNWIVMMAMEKNRERRYETANAMAMDIKHVLNHEPVLARPPSRVYRFQKLVRRNKTTFAYLAVACIAIFTGLGTSTWLFFSERKARSLAEKLETEADARTTIAQAALLLSRDRLEEANRMMKKIQIPVVKPSLEAADVFRTLATWNVSRGQWDAAADCFLKLQQANQLDKTNTTREMTLDLLGAGPALIVAGEETEYRAFVQQTLDRFSGTTDPSAAEQVLKNSLILPQDTNTLTRLESFVQMVKDSVEANEPNAEKDSYHIGYQTLAVCLYEYRAGNFTKAVEWGQRSLNYADRNPPRVAMDHLVLAMAYAGLNQPGKARHELDAGRELVQQRIPVPVKNLPNLGTPKTGMWHDWVIGHLLLQEAIPLVESSEHSK